MKPTDFRNATFEHLRDQLDGLRRRVYDAWLAHGPCTTRQLAAACGIDLLTVRPRTTELVQIGLVEIHEDAERPASCAPSEGLYRATPKYRWDEWREKQINPQIQLI